MGPGAQKSHLSTCLCSGVSEGDYVDVYTDRLHMPELVWPAKTVPAGPSITESRVSDVM